MPRWPAWGFNRTATVSYLDRFLEPVTEVLTPTLARKLADLRAEADLTAQIEGLRRKAEEGRLTPDEEAQCDGPPGLRLRKKSS